MEEREKIIETFTELSNRYEEVVDLELSTFWGWNYQSFIAYMLDNVEIDYEDKVLDIATGTGVIPRNIIDRSDLESAVIGLDITYEMLRKAVKKSEKSGVLDKIRFVCASAMEMPYQNECFSLVLCGLATHHMNVDDLLSEVNRILVDEGKLVMADVGASKLWKVPGVTFLIRILAFVYFLIKENPSRAWAEAMSVKNIRTQDDWVNDLNKWGFVNIHVRKLESKYWWIPSPLLILARK